MVSGQPTHQHQGPLQRDQLWQRDEQWQERHRQQQRDLPAYLLCFIGAVFFNMLSGNSRLLGFPIGPDRLLFGAGLTLLALDPFAWRQVRLLARPVHVFSLAVLVLATWSAYEHGTLRTSLGFYALLDRLAVPFLVFALAPVIFSTPARRDVLLRCLVVMGLYLGATAIFEMIGPKTLVYPRFILDPNIGISSGERADRSRHRRPTASPCANAAS